MKKKRHSHDIEPGIKTLWLPLISGVLLCALVIMLWLTLEMKEKSALRLKVKSETEYLASAIEADLRNRIPSIQRMTNEWKFHSNITKEEFTTYAKAYMADVPGFQALEYVDKNYFVRWIEPLKGNEKALLLNLAFEKNRYSAMKKSYDTKSPSATLPVNLVQGGKGFLAFFPIFINDEFRGYILAVFRIQEWLDYVFNIKSKHKTVSDYKISVVFGDIPVYQHEGWESLQKNEFNITVPAHLLDHTLYIHVRPTEDFIKRNRSELPLMTGVSGITLSLLVSLVIRLFQKASFEAWRTNIAKTDMENEINERRKIEQELQQSLASIDLAVKAADTGIWTWDISTDKLTWNERMYTLFDIPSGITPTYETWRNAVHPEDRQCAEHLLRKAVLGSAVFDTEFRIVLSDGNIRNIRAAATVINDSSGRALYVTGLNRDITQNRNAEEALKKSEEKVRLLLDSTGEAIYGIDLEGNCTFANPSCAKMLGYTGPEQFLGKNMHNLIHHSYADGSPMPVENCRIYRAFREGTALHVDDEVLWKADGTNFQAEYWSSPQISDGEIQGAVVTFTDITDRKEAEARIVSAKEMAEAANRAKSTFLANMSHDLRTPMNAIIGISGVLVKKYDNTSDRFREGLQLIHESGERLLTLINDLLDLSRIEAQKMDIADSWFLLRNFVSGIYATMSVLIGKKNVSFEFDTMDMDKYLFYDKEKVYRILLNLLGNAAKFTKEGSIILKIRIDNDKSLFEVSDTGIGIPEDKLQYIFEPFYQADDSTTREYSGSGLGLALCKSMAELMHGIIEIESEPGRGTSARLILPPFTGKYNKTDRAAAEEKTRIFSEKNLSAVKSILVVDDEYTGRETLRHMLECNCKITFAENGAEAVELFRKNKYDIVLLDIMMPEMDGYTVIKKMRDIKKTIPVIAVTARAMPEDKKRILEAGFTLFITKPVDQTELIDTIERFS